MRISSTHEGTILQEAEWAALVGDRYASTEEAESAGRAWRGRLERVFAYNRVPVDFGDRAPKGYATAAFLEGIQEATGAHVLNDEHGLMVYECDPSPDSFLSVGPASGFAPASRERLEATLAAIASGAPTTDAEEVAYELFSASFNAEGDARLINLVMALETLIEQQLRPERTRNLIDCFIEEARSSDLEDAQSLADALGALKRESIGRAGRRLAATLEGRTYGQFEAVELFQRAYEVRSALAHGHVPRPTREEVGAIAAPLELMVGALIAGIELIHELEDFSP